MVRERRGAAEHVRDPVEQMRVALEQRQDLHAGGKLRQELVEPLEGRVWMRLAAKAARMAGSICPSRSRARAERSARAWPVFQARTVATTRSMS